MVHCWVWPFLTDDLGPLAEVPDSGLQRAAERMAAQGLVLAQEAAPTVDATSRLVAGFPSETLIRLSTDALLLVTGTRDPGGFARLLVGSVILHLAATASCPIAVVRDDRPREGAVLVAVDESPESDRAVLAAAAPAEVLDAPLSLLHVRPVTRDSLTEPSAAGVIIDQARGASYVVLGAKGYTTIGARLGSMVHAVLHHAPGNVLVVR